MSSIPRVFFHPPRIRTPTVLTTISMRFTGLPHPHLRISEDRVKKIDWRQNKNKLFSPIDDVGSDFENVSWAEQDFLDGVDDYISNSTSPFYDRQHTQNIPTNFMDFTSAELNVFGVDSKRDRERVEMSDENHSDIPIPQVTVKSHLHRPNEAAREISERLWWLDRWRQAAKPPRYEEDHEIVLANGEIVPLDAYIREYANKGKYKSTDSSETIERKATPESKRAARRRGSRRKKRPKKLFRARQWATGLRKSVRVAGYIVPGSGKVFVDNTFYAHYFDTYSDRLSVTLPFLVTKTERTFDAFFKVIRGKGKSATADAVRLGIARALAKYDWRMMKYLKSHGMLMVDARKKERKHPGKKKARKAHRWGKR